MSSEGLSHSGAVIYINARSSSELTPGALIGFLLSCTSILYAYNPSIGRPVPTMSVAAWILVFVAAYLLWKEAANKRHWFAWTAALGCTLFATIWSVNPAVWPTGTLGSPSYRPSLILGGLALVASCTALIAYRFSPIAYLLLAIGIAAEAYAVSGSAAVAILVFSIYCVLLLALNYVVKIVIDHCRDGRLLLRLSRNSITAGDIFGLFRYAVGPLAIIGALVGSGVVVHNWLQDTLKAQLYIERVLPRSQGPDIRDEDRDMRLDAYAALDIHTQDVHTRYKQQIAAASQGGQVTATQVPSTLSKIVQNNRQPVLDSSGCSRLHIPAPRIFGRSIGGGNGVLADICRGASSSLASSIQAIYTAATDRLMQEATEKSDQAKTGIKISQEKAEAQGQETIDEARRVGRLAIDKIFLILDTLYVIGYTVLISAVLGALALVLARRVFDTVKGTPFSLGINGGSAKLETVVFSSSDANNTLRRADTLNVADFPVPKDNTPYWYVSIQRELSRSGKGLQGPVIPQPLACFFKRFPFHWSMQRIDAAEAKEAADSGRDGAKFGPGLNSNISLACIRVKKGQQIVFKMKHLIGFSNGVVLRSAYSAHVGLYLLGLGAFYSFAEGDGWLVVGVEKGGFKLSERGKNFVYPTSIVAWDRKARFLVSHTPSVSQHWLSDSMVVPQSKDGTVLIAEYGTKGTGLVVYFWRLLGYLLLPF